MEWTAIAYNNSQRVKPVWNNRGFNFTPSKSQMAVPDTKEPTLFLDMGGIIRNRPDPLPIPLDLENAYVDFGLIWGEDIIDLLMFDRGKVVVPLRKLEGFSELDDALSYAEDVTIGIDWSQNIEAKHTDFSIDIVQLLQKLHQRNQTDILVYSLQGDYPYIPAGIAVNSDIKLAYLSVPGPLPQWAKGVFFFE
tara:strand:- start:759 stop:1337 length:579 start_codon:yes stop_codon:yes gene_type:complete